MKRPRRGQPRFPAPAAYRFRGDLYSQESTFPLVTAAAAATTTRWLGSRVVYSVLDSGAEGPGFKSQPRRWQTVHTHRASVHQAAKLVRWGLSLGLYFCSPPIPNVMAKRRHIST